MREYDEMSTRGFWARRKERMQREAKEAAAYANSATGKKEAALRTVNFLLSQEEGRKLSEIEQQQLKAAEQLLDEMKKEASN